MQNCLRQVPLFAGISEQNLAALAAVTVRGNFHKDQTVWRTGGSADQLYLVLSGMIKRTVLSAGGSERVLELLTAGDCLGAPELLAGRCYSTSATAVKPTTVLAIAGGRVRCVMESEPGLALRMSRFLAARQLDVEDEFTTGQSSSSSERVLDYLLQQVVQPLANCGETELQLPASKQLIASRIGISPETLSRALRELVDGGLLAIHRSTVRLQNVPLHLRHLQYATGISSSADAEGVELRLARGAIDQEQLNSLINISGRQRMLSQRMTKSWLMLGCGVLPSRARKMLGQSIELFERQMALLANAAANDEIGKTHQALSAVWHSYRAALEQSPRADHAVALFALNEDLLQAAEKLTSAFVRLQSAMGLVNVAGRQRMLAERIAKLYLFSWYDVNVETCHSEMALARQQFNRARNQLQAATCGDASINSVLGKIDRRWGALEATLDAVQSDESARTICDASDQLVRQADSAVQWYERNERIERYEASAAA